MAAAKDIQYEGHHLHNFYNFKLAHGLYSFYVGLVLARKI